MRNDENRNPALDGAEPVAIVGMGCRLPGGVDTPGELWTLLLDGRDATGEVPEDRWAQYTTDPELARTLRGTTRRGGYLADAAGFDAEFFGVTPREAELMDPQQRVALEVAWRALEDAGIPADSLAGTDTGVFVGVGSDDYGRQMLEDLPRIEAWTGIGASMCAVANRISYVLDLRGPSLAVDTACSASLVALHLACQSLRAGESTLALAGGINIIAGPSLTMVLDAAGATAPDGRSKSFDASANGYGRGEGCGMLVLKLLSDAERDGDPVLAVVRGTAVSQDGRTNGIMAPNPHAQELVVRQALAQAGLPAAGVGYVEAHGTGTRAGDPIEAAALAAVYGEGRADRPCLLGSIKANIGHLEAGAGVAGVLKAVLALRHGTVPPTVNLVEPNPAIPWPTNGLRPVTTATPFPVPADGQPRRAGVSSFGYGGTVAHAVLQEAPVPAHAAADPGSSGQVVVAVSGATDAGVAANAGALADWLATSEVPLRDVAHTSLRRRSHAKRRAAVVATGRDDLVAGLRALAEGEERDGVATGEVLPGGGREPVWVFSGHGSQWVGMGRELLRQSPVFAASIDALADIFRAEIGFTPREALLTDTYTEADRIQPMIYAMQVSLAAVWRDLGLRPAAVIGHSVGEIAAAVVAGLLGPADGATLICRRSALLRRVTGAGAMAMAGLRYEEAAERLAGRTDVVAAISAAPSQTVISGAPGPVREIADAWAGQGLFVRMVASDVAFHSPQMDPLLPDLEAALAGLRPRAGSVPVYSTVLADPLADVPRDASYWAANLRQPVRFAAAVAAAARDGHRAFLEVSAHPVVTHSIADTLAEGGIAHTCVTGTLRRNRPELATLLGNLGLLHCHGVPVDWSQMAAGGELAAIPPTVWQHRRYWREPTVRTGALGRHDPESHTLLGTPLAVSGSTTRLWQTVLDEESRPYPGRHPIHGVEVVPAAVLLATFLAAGDTRELADVRLRAAVKAAPSRDVQVVLDDDAIRLASRPAGSGTDSAWLANTSAIARPATRAGLGDRVAPEVLWTECVETYEPGLVVEHLHRVGVADVGFGWTVDRLAGSDGFLVASLGAVRGGAAGGWAPAFDAILSVAPLLFASEADGEPVLRMPSAIGRLAVAAECPDEILVAVRRSDGDTVEVAVLEPGGEVVGRFEKLRFARLDGDPGADEDPRRLVHRTVWRTLETEASGTPGEVVVVGRPGPVADGLLRHAAAAGARCHGVVDRSGLAALLYASDTPLTVVVAPDEREPGGAASDRAAGSAWELAEAVQTVASSGNGAKVWALTTGVRDAATPSGLVQSPRWGLGRVIAGEHPDCWRAVVDLPGEPSGADLATLAGLLGTDPREPVISLGGGVAEVPRLITVTEETTGPAVTCRPDGTYLITGGLGVLGLEVAGWLAGRGARRLLLVGRTGLPRRDRWAAESDPAVRRRIEAIQALEARGVTVRAVATDVTDPAALAAAVDIDALGLPPVRGVVHAAGVLDNRFLSELDEASLRTVMAPKVAGVLALGSVYPPGALDFLVLFSSNGQLLGLTGQASYASANSFLDAYARQRGGDALSLAWTSWRGLGMAVSEVVDQELADRGVGSVSATEAFGSWELAWRTGEPNLAVMRTIGRPATGEPLPLLSELEFGTGEEAPADEAEPGWAGLDPAELAGWLRAEVSRQVAAELRVDDDQLDPERPLTDLGLDSVMTLVIRRRLERRFRQSLPATLLWTYPSISAVAGHLAGLLRPAGEPATPETAAPTAVGG